MEQGAPNEMPLWGVVLIPLAFFVIFPIFWCFVLWILSKVGGWSRLAEKYQTEQEPNGKPWRGVSGRIGLVSYNGVITCTTNESGMFLQPIGIFRFAHPRLLLPWSDFHNVRKLQILWQPLITAKIGDPKVGSLALDGKVFTESEGRNLLEERSSHPPFGS